MLVTDRLQRTATTGVKVPASSARAHVRNGRPAVLATPRMVLGLRTTPLLACAGALLLSTGLHRDDDVMFAIGGLVALASIALFQTLRLALIARCEAHGVSADEANAHQRAVREADTILSTLCSDDLRSAKQNEAARKEVNAPEPAAP